MFLLIALENLFPPIPSEVILSFAGFITCETRLGFGGVVAAATAGSVVGAIVLYAAGRFISSEKLALLLNGKLGRALHLEGADVEKASVWFCDKGALSVFYCRMIPIVRSLISIPAGMAKMPFWKFIWLTTMGSTVWNVLLVGAGALAGENWQAVSEAFAEASAGIKIVLAAVTLGIALWLYLKKRNKANSTAV